jgi:hypothetical protein
MAYRVRFANGEILRGESLDDARRCVEAARKLDGAEVRFPAEIWEQPHSEFAFVDPATAPEPFRGAARLARLRISPAVVPVENHDL